MQKFPDPSNPYLFIFSFFGRGTSLEKVEPELQMHFQGLTRKVIFYYDQFVLLVKP